MFIVRITGKNIVKIFDYDLIVIKKTLDKSKRGFRKICGLAKITYSFTRMV